MNEQELKKWHEFDSEFISLIDSYLKIMLQQDKSIDQRNFEMQKELFEICLFIHRKTVLNTELIFMLERLKNSKAIYVGEGAYYKNQIRPIILNELQTEIGKIITL